MNATKAKKLKHLQWAIESRAQNQRCALRLLRLFMEYEEKWKTKSWAGAAQGLLSVSFSLWRAAFLADKIAKRAAVFSHATDFLEKIIEDNAISYTQDRKCNEWTFNYYTRNARTALETLNEHWPEQVPVYARQRLTPTERWRYCQELLDVAVEQFDLAARDLQAKKTSTEQAKQKAKAIRSASKARRGKVRVHLCEQKGKGMKTSSRKAESSTRKPKPEYALAGQVPSQK
ncbi:MAG: hypothetical protein H0X40_11760 [Chthoniobacterales bacterium]|nr:hypothetical protein [Chthoniobacterales bacterium]